MVIVSGDASGRRREQRSFSNTSRADKRHRQARMWHIILEAHILCRARHDGDGGTAGRAECHNSWCQARYHCRGGNHGGGRAAASGGGLHRGCFLCCFEKNKIAWQLPMRILTRKKRVRNFCTRSLYLPKIVMVGSIVGTTNIKVLLGSGTWFDDCVVVTSQQSICFTRTHQIGFFSRAIA